MPVTAFCRNVFTGILTNDNVANFICHFISFYLTEYLIGLIARNKIIQVKLYERVVAFTAMKVTLPSLIAVVLRE